jgi:large subunit ribosomal protein L13
MRVMKKSEPKKAKAEKPAAAKPEAWKPRWLLYDADGMVLGRLASEIAQLLRGKHRPQFVPNAESGEFVVVINSAKVKLTGRKWARKMYHDHTGFPGGMRERPAEMLHARHPTELIKRAVKGMLPRGPLGYRMLSKLKIYAGAEHPHQAQKPEKVQIKGK